jgi:MFS family permease
MNSTGRAVRGWVAAVAVYLLAVFHRSSLSVAGLMAEQRFGITPAQLSVFALMQMGVYAAMQVPTGILVDRYGPRRVLVTAATVMGAAQLLFAVVPSYPAALAARALLGFGDALTFVSVLRYTAARFDARRYPLLVALTSMVGTVGNVLATLPLTLLLRSIGWGTSFAGAACLSLLAGVGVWLVLPESAPVRRVARDVTELRMAGLSVGRRIRAAWQLPGTRLGFWVHFASMSAATAFGVLWGGVYLEKGVGFTAAQAGAVLMSGVAAATLASPFVGSLIGRRPAVRVPLALGVCAGTVTCWLVTVLAFGDTPPKAWAVVLFVLMTLGGPASMVAFALARDYNRSHTLGTASGVVNVGGFVAAILVALGIGWVLDLTGGTTPHHLRLAVLVAVAVQSVGGTRMAIWYRRVRALVHERELAGEPVPVHVVPRRWDTPALRSRARARRPVSRSARSRR